MANAMVVTRERGMNQGGTSWDGGSNEQSVLVESFRRVLIKKHPFGMPHAAAVEMFGDASWLAVFAGKAVPLEVVARQAVALRQEALDSIEAHNEVIGLVDNYTRL